MGNILNAKPINTVFSVDSIIDNEEIITAKKFMNDGYGNKYSHIPPHLAYAIVPFPEYNFEKAKEVLKAYVLKLKPYTLTLSDLKFDDKNNLFSISVSGDDIKRLHTEITTLLNEFRDGAIREKDLERINSNYFNDKELAYLKQYGYARVFDCFSAHISIGNFTIKDVDVNKLTNTLKDMLKGVLNKTILLKNIHAVFHTDASNQQGMKVIWEETFSL